MQEDNVPTDLFDGHMKVLNTRPLIGESGQLLIVSGKQGLGFHACRQLPSHCPCYGDAIECACTTPHLIENDEAS